MGDVSDMHHVTQRFEEIEENYEKLRVLKVLCHLVTLKENQVPQENLKKKKKQTNE